MFSNINEVWGNDPLKRITEKIKYNNLKKSTDDSTNSNTNSDFISMTENANIEQTKPILKKKPIINDESDLFSNFTDNYNHNINPSGFAFINQPSINTNGNGNSNEINNCNKIVSHVNNCIKCKQKLDKIIKRKVKEECEDLLFENKLLKLNSNSNTNTNSSSNIIKTGISDNFKETMIIIVAAFVVVFILFILYKGSS
jgi:hypothetical protein